jgi:hypothetical protein
VIRKKKEKKKIKKEVSIFMPIGPWDAVTYLKAALEAK